MTTRYLELLVTPAVARAQRATYGTAHATGGVAAADALGPDELEFVGQRDSFYLATVSESGWPYVQHRGGPRGFLHALDPRTLGFADVRGNRQLLTAGNVSADPRVSLFLMDYPARARLKILGRATCRDARDEPELAARLGAGLRQRVERIVTVTVEAFDWNCSQNITPRWTAEEVEAFAAPLRSRIDALTARLRAAGIAPEEVAEGSSTPVRSSSS